MSYEFDIVLIASGFLSVICAIVLILRRTCLNREVRDIVINPYVRTTIQVDGVLREPSDSSILVEPNRDNIVVPIVYVNDVTMDPDPGPDLDLDTKYTVAIPIQP